MKRASFDVCARARFKTKKRAVFGGKRKKKEGVFFPKQFVMGTARANRNAIFFVFFFLFVRLSRVLLVESNCIRYKYESY